MTLGNKIIYRYKIERVYNVYVCCRECVEFYGEERQQTDTSGFFSAILKFVRAYKAADNENEQRRRLSSRNQSPPETLVKVAGKKQQVRLAF